MVSKANPLVAAVGLAKSGQSYPVMDLIQQSPEIAAAISKLVTPIQHKPTFGNKGERQFPHPNVFQMRQVSNNIAANASDAETVMQILPDMELSAQILVSSILSPKDMLTTTLHFKPPEGLLPQQVTAQMIQKIDQHFDSSYRIKSELPRILREVLFETGSHIRAVLPENSVDELINRSLAIKVEDLSEIVDATGRVRSVGILGSYKKQESAVSGGISMEAFRGVETVKPVTLEDHSLHLSGEFYSFKVGTNAAPTFKENQKITFENVLDNHVTVTDNISVLKMPSLNRRIQEDRVHRSVPNLNIVGDMLAQAKSGLSMEGRKDKKLTDKELTSATYRDAQTGYEPVMVAKTQEQLKRRTIGNPLILDLPSESVIPVHVPGQQDKHVGYFVMLDANGNPISRKNQKDYYAEMSQRMSSGNGNGTSFASQLTSRVQNLMGGFDCSNNEHLDYSARVYADMVEQDLLARLRNGLYTNGVALARNEEVYRIMLARTLSSKHTQLLFLPVEMVTYFAFRYNGDGIGRSLLDDMKVLNSLRAMMTFANVMAGVRNSIGMTDLKFRLDPDDGDPLKSIEMMLNEIIRVKSQSFPLGVNSPVDLVKYLQRAAYTFTYENHPGLPDMSVEQTERNTNYVKPDTELEENLRKRAIMATGLNPETVDAGFNAEFATSVVNNNILLSRRVMQLQEVFCPQLTDHLRKVAMGTESLIRSLKQIIEGNFEEIKLDEEEIEAVFGKDNAKNQALIVPYLLDRFMRGLTVELPRPNTVTVESQTQMLQNFIGLLDLGIEAWFSDEFFTENLVGKFGGQASEFKKLLRAYFIRQYMAENNILPELSSMVAKDDEGKPDYRIWDENATHLKSLLGPLAVMLRKIEEVKNAADVIAEPLMGDGSGGSSDDLGSDTPAGGDDSGGLDGLGGDDIPGLDDEVPETPTGDGAGTPTEEKTPDAEPNSEEQPKPDQPS
jgi:hypothetical protein